MKFRLQNVARLAVMAAALGLSAGALAQAKGDYMLKFGVNEIKPKVKSGEFDAPTLPGSTSDVGPDTQPLLTGAYMLTDNISTELILGLPYTHRLYGDGMIKGVGVLGTVKVLPPTLFAQYRFFQPEARFRPYVGLGVTYAYFRKETGSSTLTAFLDPGGKPSTFQMDAKWAASAQIGATVKLQERWFLDLAVVKTKLKTTAHFNTGQTITADLDPVALSAAIGYQF